VPEEVEFALLCVTTGGEEKVGCLGPFDELLDERCLPDSTTAANGDHPTLAQVACSSPLVLDLGQLLHAPDEVPHLLRQR
jgi:hypothetical protein